MLARIERGLGYLALALAIVGSLSAAALALVTVIAVFWRYLLKNPIFGIEDFSVLLLTIVAAAGVAYGTGKGAHVSVDVIKHVVSPSVTRWTDALMRLLATMICAFASFALVDRACGIEKACITENLSVEHAPFYYILSLAMAVMAATYAVQLFLGLTFRPSADQNETVG